MPVSQDAFVAGLASAVPETQALVDEHYRENEELLLHLLMADIARLAYAEYRANHIEVVGRLLSYVDQGLREGDHLVDNAVVLSFVEMFDPRRPGQQKFIASWPPALKAEAKRRAR